MAILVSGDASLHKPVDCGDGVGIPLSLAFLGAFRRQVCWGRVVLVLSYWCPCQAQLRVARKGREQTRQFHT